MKQRTEQSKNLSLQHALATLAYRAAKVLSQAPKGFFEFKASADTRSAGEILAHLADLLDWALSQAQGKQKWRTLKPRSWEKDTARFFNSMEAFDCYLASDADFHDNAGRVFQGAIADALTHVGQLAMLRRLAGAPIRGENYHRARIETGRVGPDQHAPVSEFD